MNNLPNTNYNYDPARVQEIQGFLDHIATIIRDNPGLYVNKDIVYRELCKWGIKNTDLGADYQGYNIGALFNMWSQRFRNHKNIDVFCSPDWPYFCQFVNNYSAPAHNIKLYLSLDKEHIFEGANQLFDFVNSLGIKHQSKIGKQIRSDGIVIRLDYRDVDSAKKIIDFINSNPYIRAGMNRVNPFLPSIKGVGYMVESGISYNSEIAEQVSNYLNILKQQGKCFGNVEEFRQFVEQNAYHKEVISTLNKACTGGFSKVYKEQPSNNGLTADQKYNLFMDAMKATLRKYGLEQVKTAVYSAVAKGDYRYFTNGDRAVKYRSALKSNISPTEMGRMIYSTLETSVGSKNISRELPRNVEKFCNVLFMNAQALVLDEICNVTIENHSIDQVRAALAEFATIGRTDKFSRYVKGSRDGVNYRDMIARMDRNRIVELIRASLALKGKTLNSNDMYELISAYAYTLDLGRYAQNNQVEGLSRKAL
jgi:hypothetical protein